MPFPTVDPFRYDVFPSFKGKDTRSLVSKLYSSFKDKGINAFTDDDRLRIGVEVSPELIQAIRSSEVCLLILSENYAASRRCREELAQIMDCRRTLGQTVCPVFYHVNPSDFRKQKGYIGDLFAMLEAKMVSDDDRDAIAHWRADLTEIASLSGWHIVNGLSEVASTVEDIAGRVLRLTDVKNAKLHVPESIVGFDSHLSQMNALLNDGYNDVRFIGVCGMGGIGKTTLVKMVWNQLYHNFEAKSFLRNVRETSEHPDGVLHLQELLINDILQDKVKINSVSEGVAIIKSRFSQIRVLIVLDDVTHFQQLKSLAGGHNWFGIGSTIIVTSRDLHLLNQINADSIHTLGRLSDSESLELFSWHSLRTNHLIDKFAKLSQDVVNYCEGLPLALKVLGSLLHARSVECWEDTLERLKVFPQRDIQDHLKISFDALNHNEKLLFLHIACFLIGWDKDHAISVLEGCGVFAKTGLQVLSDRFLVEIHGESNKLKMHIQLQQMGREIVRQESPGNPGKRSRLWFYADSIQVLENELGTSTVEGLVLNQPEFHKIHAQAFRNMDQMKLLQLNNVSVHGNYGLLSKELRLVYWHKFPLEFIPEEFYMGNMVSIDMQHSKLQAAWKRKKVLMNLKFLNLSHSHSLENTPDFSGLLNLEELILEDCIKLKEVHPSIGHLRRLILLSLKNCKRLESLPLIICSVFSLQNLDISGCSRIKALPNDFGRMEALVKLRAQGTAIRNVPPSIARLKNLKELSLPDYKASSSTTTLLLRLSEPSKETITAGLDVTATEIQQAGSIPKGQSDDNQASPSGFLDEDRQTKRMRHMDKIYVPDAMPRKVLLILGCYGSSIARFISHLSRTLKAAGISTVNTMVPMYEMDFKEQILMPIFTKDENPLLSWRSSNLKYMVDCGMRSPEKVILPVFYNTEPSQILQIAGDWMAKTTPSTSLMETLRDVANTSGWVVRKPSCAKVISSIAREVSDILGYTHVDMADHVVGINPKVEIMMDLLDLEVTDKRIVGICGIGGIGKTALARAVYGRISPSFEGSCFLEDIGETIKRRRDGLQFLQTKLISDVLKRDCEKIGSVDEGISFLRRILSEMRVLIVLDDVDCGFNLEELVGQYDSIGPGSRIIMTTRCKDNLPGGITTYDIPKMSYWEIHQLFKRYVPRENTFPDAVFLKIKQDIVSTIGGLPLVVEVIGSFLSHKSVSVWKDTAEKLRRLPQEEIYKKLMISFETLNPQQKQIFMDIACFADREDSLITSYLWHYPVQAEGLKCLLDMGLVKIGENKELLMHRELRVMGRLLSRQININEGTEVDDVYRPWVQEASFEAVSTKKGIENAESLRLCFDDRSEYQDMEFQIMPNIRYLQLDGGNIIGDFNDMFINLMWLHWEGCPANFCASNLHLKNLVILNLSRSGITESWGGWSQLKMANALKVLNLTGCAELSITPDFSGFPDLEILILEHCCTLVKLDPSICYLEKLRSLNLRFCSELTVLPEELGLLKSLSELLVDGTPIREIPVSLGHIENIKTLTALGCYSLTVIPPSLGYLKSLVDLSLSHTKMNELPSSIRGLVKLQRLSVRDCRWLSELPRSIGELSDSLLELDVSRTGISRLPNSIGKLQKLRILKTEYCFIEEFPSAILKLVSLEGIYASYCRSLKQFIPSETVTSEHGKLESLKILRLDYSGVSNFPSNFCDLVSNLSTLDLLHCDMLKVLPELPASLTSLRFSSNEMEKLPVLHDLTHLEELILADCDFEELVYQETNAKGPRYQRILGGESGDTNDSLVLSHMSMLKRLELYLSRIRIIQLPSSNWCTSLRKLVVHCPDLKTVPLFPITLLNLSVRYCWSLETLEVGNMKVLSELQFHDSGVGKIRGLRELKGLRMLNISNCKVEDLKGLEELESLTSLIVSNCDHLTELPRLKNPEMLRELEIRGCKNIEDIKCNSNLTFCTESMELN